MPAAQVRFEKRLGRIVRDHQRMTQGVVHVMRQDGLIVARPRVYNPKFPLRGLILLIGTALLFKGYIYASIGAGSYQERVAQLAEGSMVEKAGAWIMQADVATIAVAQVLNSLGL